MIDQIIDSNARITESAKKSSAYNNGADFE